MDLPALWFTGSFFVARVSAEGLIRGLVCPDGNCVTQKLERLEEE
jgi:hypothetical protein